MGNDWMSAAFAACVTLASAASIAAAAGELKKAPFKGIIGQSALGAAAAALAFLLFLAGLGRPSLFLEILRDPTSRFFWKATPLVILAVFLVSYIVLQYRSAGRRSAEVCVVLAAASGLIGAAALGTVQKLPLRPLLDTNLTALVFLSLSFAAASVMTIRAGKTTSLAFPAAAAFFVLASMTGYGLLMLGESTEAPEVFFLFSAVLALAVLGLSVGSFLKSRASEGFSLLLLAGAATLFQFLLQQFVTAQWHFF